MCPTSEMGNGKSLWWTDTLLDRRSMCLFVIRIYWLVPYLPTTFLTLDAFGTGKRALLLLDSQHFKNSQSTVLPSISCMETFLSWMWFDT